MLHDEGYIYIGECGVDSGQLILVDPCYVMRTGYHDEEKLSYDNMIKDNDYTDFEREVLFSGVGGTGVLTGTGHGDGGYPVFVKYVEDYGKRVSDVIVKFIFSDEDIAWLESQETDSFSELFKDKAINRRKVIDTLMGGKNGTNS